MPRGFLPLSDRTKEEVETSYPYFLTMRGAFVSAMSERDPVEKKRIIFNSLRQIESCVSSEFSRLRNKPNRCTKYSIYMKRFIMILRISLDSLPCDEQLEANPTLALILSHFINMILQSSLKTTELPKFMAVNLYSFLKVLFSNDVEFILDILIGSNVFDNAQFGNASMGMNILLEAVVDGYLYTNDISALAKYLAIVGFIYQIFSDNEDEHQNEIIMKIIQELETCVIFTPTDVIHYLITDFHMTPLPKKKLNQLNWERLLKLIKPRQIASITAGNQRLSVVSGKSPPVHKDSIEAIMNVSTHDNQYENEENGQQEENEKQNFTTASANRSPSSSAVFFMDRGGDFSEEEEKEEDNQQVSSSNSISMNGVHDDSFQQLPHLMVMDNDFDEDDDAIRNITNQLLPSTRSPRTRSKTCSANSSMILDKYNNENDMLPNLSPRKSFIDVINENVDDEAEPDFPPPQSGPSLSNSAKKASPSPKKSKPLKYESDSDSDELEVLFEERAPPKKLLPTPKKNVALPDNNSDDDENKEEEEENGNVSDTSRDYAPSESGESDVPYYSPSSDYIRKNNNYSAATVNNANMNEDNQNNDMIKADADTTTSTTHDNDANNFEAKSEQDDDEQENVVASTVDDDNLIQLFEEPEINSQEMEVEVADDDMESTITTISRKRGRSDRGKRSGNKTPSCRPRSTRVKKTPLRYPLPPQ